MQLYLLEEPTGEKYIDLMNYAFNKSNILTFEIIDFDVTDKIYDEKIKNILKELKQDFIKMEPYGVRGNTYCYKISSKVKELLLKENKLYDFSYPKNPENICLLNNDTTWMEIVSHEQMCTIYGNEEDANYLDKIGIEYETFKDYTVED